MFHTPWFKRRSFQGVLSLLGLVLVSFTFLASAPLQMSNEHTQGGLDPRIEKIMDAPPYRHAEWGLTVLVPDTLNNRFTLEWALAGYLEVRPGRYYAYDLVVNGSVMQDFSGVIGVADDLANVSAILQEEAAM